MREQYPNAVFLNEYIKRNFGFELEIWVGSIPLSDKIIFLNSDENLDIKDEGYHFSIQEKEIRITSKNPAGVFYGLQTFISTDAGEFKPETPLS